jgi:hypothetical protein
MVSLVSKEVGLAYTCQEGPVEAQAQTLSGNGRLLARYEEYIPAAEVELKPRGRYTLTGILS